MTSPVITSYFSCGETSINVVKKEQKFEALFRFKLLGKRNNLLTPTLCFHSKYNRKLYIENQKIFRYKREKRNFIPVKRNTNDTGQNNTEVSGKSVKAKLNSEFGCCQTFFSSPPTHLRQALLAMPTYPVNC